MWTFLVDEDMPRSTAVVLREAGYIAFDVRDVGLRGHSDRDVFAFAQTQGAVLVTEDMGFANVLNFSPASHCGLIVLRVPNELPTAQVNRELLRSLMDVDGQDLRGVLVIVEIGRTRIRR